MRNAKRISEASRPLTTFVAVDPESLPTGTAPNYTFRYIDIASATQGKLLLPDDEIEYRDAPSRARRVLRDGDVIMSTVRPNLKGFAYCRLPPGNFVASTGFAVLRAKEGTDPRFILYSILSDDVTRQIERFVVGSNYPAINSADVKRLLIPNLSPGEQERAGEIIGTFDEAIEQTEALIAKTEEMNAALMHDLFTRGVTADGQVRPPRQEAPQLYKESQLGWVPREWDVQPIRVIFRRRVERGRPGLPVMAVTMTDGLVPREDVDRRVESKLTPEQHLFVAEGDVAYNMMRMWQGVLGRAAYDCLVSPAYVVMTPTEKLESRFAEGLLSLPESIAKFKRMSYGVVDDRLRLYARDLARIELAFPVRLEEQETIANRRDAIGEQTASLKAELRKILQLRSGVLEDILTGRVPVAPGAECPRVEANV